MQESSLKLMAYVEMYTPDPVNSFFFVSGLGQVIISHKKIVGDSSQTWGVKINQDDTYYFERGEIWDVLRTAQIAEEQFFNTMRNTITTFAGMALIGVDDIADIVGRNNILESKTSWESFLRDVLAIADRHLAQPTQEATQTKIIPLRPKNSN